MVECDTCGQELQGTVFECRECGAVNCGDHRAAEDHDCTTSPDWHRGSDPAPAVALGSPESSDERTRLERFLDPLVERFAVLTVGLALALPLLFVVVLVAIALEVGTPDAGSPATAVDGIAPGILPGAFATGALCLVLVGLVAWWLRTGPAEAGGSGPGVHEWLVGKGSLLFYRLRRSVRGGDPTVAQGMVAFSGTAVPRDGNVASPVEDEPCAFSLVAVDGYEDRTDATFGVDEPRWPDLVVDAAAEPFAVDTGDGRVVVDPNPWDPGVGRLDADRIEGRAPHQWPGTRIEYSTTVGRTLTLADLDGELRDRVHEALTDRGVDRPPEDVWLAVTVRRLDADTPVAVLGWGVGDREFTDADVRNLARARRPFRVDLD